MLQVAIVQVLLPVGVAAWLLLGRPRAGVDLHLRIAAGWLVLVGIAIAGVWLAVPLVAVIGLMLLMLLASAVAFFRGTSIGPKSGKVGSWLGRIVALALAGLGVWAAGSAVAGWRKPAGTVDLQFPFHQGRYIVANGGSTERINGHFMTLEPRYRRWRGESFAVDLIQIDAAGFRTRAKRLFYVPQDPADYLTFGTMVHAPCGGVVDATDSGRPDMPVPKRDRQQLEGNFVRIRCGAHTVLLGHFRRNGVLVKAGDRVQVGQRLGTVGNSGNTDEPHLHIHVQTPGTADAPLSGQPIPVTFNGRFLVRNMVVWAGSDHDS